MVPIIMRPGMRVKQLYHRTASDGACVTYFHRPVAALDLRVGWKGLATYAFQHQAMLEERKSNEDRAKLAV
jgi:hypothetical protein